MSPTHPSGSQDVCLPEGFLNRAQALGCSHVVKIACYLDLKGMHGHSNKKLDSPKQTLDWHTAKCCVNPFNLSGVPPERICLLAVCSVDLEEAQEPAVEGKSELGAVL